MQVADKTVVIAGLGVSGTSLAEVLRERGTHVIGVDERKPEADLHSFDDVDWDHVDYVMSSPVFNPRTPFVLEAQRRGIPVMSEVEFAWQLRVNNERTGTPAPWIGITGTNGKTSTTEMHDVLCVELSSFQLHFTDSLALDCAAITNIADDHLDWHGGRENYAADKSKVFHNAKRAIVYNAQDAKVSELAAEAQTAEGCRKVGFTLEAPQAGQIGIEDGWIVDRSGVAGGAVGESVRLAAITDFTHLAEPDGSLYPHLVADALTALALVLGLGADRDTALKALTSFKPGGHRIETVAEAAVEGGSVRFVDDSKATNGHAARASLSSFPAKSVIWIAGGLAKGSRFEDLVKDQAHTIKAAVIIGKDQQPMIEAFASQAPDIPVTIIDPEDNDTVMDRAVEACGTYTAAGDIVLMAPACASMDQFKSYADRGNRFAAAAKTWSEVHGLH